MAQCGNLSGDSILWNISLHRRFGMTDRPTPSPPAPGFYPKSKCREASGVVPGLPPSTGAASETSLAEINREKANKVPPEKGRSLNLGLIGRQKRFSRACREGKTGTKAVTSSARRGALAMWAVAAWITYHIACANVNIASCDTIAQNRSHHETLMTGYSTSEPCRCAPFGGHRRSDRQLQHGGVLTFA
jgi:hypothetical protein